MALVDRPEPKIYDPNDSKSIVMDPGPAPSIAGDKFVASVSIAVAFLILVVVILLFRHRRRIGQTVGDKSLDAIASAVKAKRSLSASIERRIKDK